jgi:hypothetical protein
VITAGQIYEAVAAKDRVPSPGERNGMPRRIRVVSEPSPFHGVYGYGKVMVETVLPDGRGVRRRRIELSELHESATTKHGQPRRNGYVLVMSAEGWNAQYPVGTPVTAYPGFRPEVGGADVPTLHTHTRTPAWNLGPEPVVMVDGYAGGISLDHIDLRDETPGDPR